METAFHKSRVLGRIFLLRIRARYHNLIYCKELACLVGMVLPVHFSPAYDRYEESPFHGICNRSTAVSGSPHAAPRPAGDFRASGEYGGDIEGADSGTNSAE